jgi:hypothetical protein
VEKMMGFGAAIIFWIPDGREDPIPPIAAGKAGRRIFLYKLTGNLHNS